MSCSPVCTKNTYYTTLVTPNLREKIGLESIMLQKRD